MKRDFIENKQNTKGLFIIFFLRVSAFFNKNIILKILGFPIRFLFKIIVNWILGVDIPDSTKIGKGLKIYHGQGLIIHKNVKIGENVILRQNTTIGVSSSGIPIIENHVEIGANCNVFGGIIICEGAIIGAMSLVNKNIPPYCVAVGIPAKPIKLRFSTDEELAKVLRNVNSKYTVAEVKQKFANSIRK